MFSYPKVNYIGNKEKIASWICDHFPKEAESVFDAFSGGCSLAYEAKYRGLKVLTNDVLEVNYHLANALIANNSIILETEDIELIFSGEPFEGFMFENYSEVHFFPQECKELDLYRKNIENLDSQHKKSLAYSLMRRAMIRKMPYSRFNIKWEKVVQLRDEEYSYEKYKRKRAYHNQSFRFHFLKNLDEYNRAVFDNSKQNKAYNENIFDIASKVSANVIYLDPPYAGTMNNYFGFYGLIDSYISQEVKKPFEQNFTDKKTVFKLFDKLFSKLQNFKYWYLSYNNSSAPSKDELLFLIGKYSDDVKVIEREHVYQITGKEKKKKNKEYLFVIRNTNFQEQAQENYVKAKL